jgi:hypothetical protein
MTATFPTDLPNVKTNFDGATSVASSFQNQQGEEINALAVKVGKDGSAVTTTHDYKLSGVTGTDKAASLTGSETLTNKTISSPTGIVKGDVGLGNVDNTSDSTKNSAEATLTNKTLTTPVIASFYQDAGKTKLMTTPNTASDTLAALAATQTFTNKTLTTPVIASFYQDAGLTKLMTTPDTASDTLATLAATQTFTNKTHTNPIINYTDTTISVNVKVSARLNAAQSVGTGAITAIVYDTELFDTGSDFNTTTGIFTAPVTGYYFVSHNVTVESLKDGGRVISYIYVNSANAMSVANTAGVATNVGACAAGIFYVTSGQAIQGCVYHDHGSNRDIVSGVGESMITIILLSI